MRHFVWIAIVLFLHVHAAAQYREPSGGRFPTNLYVFIDELNKGILADPFGVKFSIDKEIKRKGDASWRWEVASTYGAHIMWGGWGKDTTVFWAHNNSYLSFWARPGNDKVMINVLLGYMDGQHEVLPMSVVGPAGVWKYFEILLPKEAVGRPLNDLKILTNDNNGGPTTLHFDDMKISQVRLYAGKGVPLPITGLFADQIGYDPGGIKSFSSEEYQYYDIVRFTDKSPVYRGTDKRMVASNAMGDRAAYIGDFTQFRTPGRYFIRLDNGKESYPFDINQNVYDAPLRAAIRFFYFQRNNTAIEQPYAEGPWVHLKDEKELVDMPGMKGKKVVRNGWHDAGDLAIYMANHTYACFWLALAWDDFRYDSDTLNIPESGDGIPDILNELKWGTDWILDMQDPTDGGFHQTMCVRDGSPYEYGKTTPLTITGYRLTQKTTSATAAAVGMLAYAATLFERARIEDGYIKRMRSAANAGWKFLQNHPKQISSNEKCDMYHDPDDIHARFFAAAGMFLMTGEEIYNKYFIANDPGSAWISDYNNQTVLAYLLYLRSKDGNPSKIAELKNLIATRAREATGDRLKHPFGFIGYYYWGSLGTALARASNFTIPDWILNSNETSMFTSLQQLHYIFGQNSLSFVYLSGGFGTNGMKNSFHHWLKTLNATPRNFPGMLPGGPQERPDPNDRDYPPHTRGYSKPADTPIDSRYADTDSWSTNEIAVNQNAQLVYVLAAAQDYARRTGGKENNLRKAR